MRIKELAIAATVILATVPVQAQTEKISSTTLDDQKDISVTVYNNNLALVRDTRNIKLDKGEVSLKFMDVAEQIKTETVSMRSLDNPGKLYVLEQNYEYDLMSPQKMMEKYVGKTVRLVNQHKDLGFFEVDAKLMSVNNGVVYEIDGEIHLGHPGNVVLPEIPDELISKPTLIWKLKNGNADHTIETTYLTQGISWKADYVINLNKESTNMNLDGWVTLNNGSGATYTDAQLKLVAGDVNVVQPDYNMMRAKSVRQEMAMDMAAPAGMQQESFAEYHLYTLPRRTTIKQNAEKQVSLLSGADIDVKKIYEYRGRVHYYSQKMGHLKDQKAEVYLSFMNEKDNGLGIPLPKGTMRIYQEDKSGSPQFAGEDRIQHTPKDEEIRLKMGQAFDVVAERIQKDYKVLGGNRYECEFEILIRNHKEEAIVVDVVEPMPGDWKIVEKSQDFDKKDAHSAIFHVPVKADEEAKVTYRVQVRF